MPITEELAAVRRVRRCLKEFQLLYNDSRSELVPPGEWSTSTIKGWPTLRARRLLPGWAQRCSRALLKLAELADRRGVDVGTTLPLREFAQRLQDGRSTLHLAYRNVPAGNSPYWRAVFTDEVMERIRATSGLVDRIAAVLSVPRQTVASSSKGKGVPTADMRALALVRKWDLEVKTGKRKPYKDQDVADEICVARTYLADKRKCPGYRRWKKQKEQRKQGIDRLDREGLPRDRRSTAPGVARPKEDDPLENSG